MTVKWSHGGRTIVCGALALSLVGSAVLPSGQVISVIGTDVSLDDDHGEFESIPEPVSPPAALVTLMDDVVALQMQSVIAPDGNAYLVLGASLQALPEAGGFGCAAILHRYGSYPTCEEVLGWPRQ